MCVEAMGEREVGEMLKQERQSILNIKIYKVVIGNYVKFKFVIFNYISKLRYL